MAHRKSPLIEALPFIAEVKVGNRGKKLNYWAVPQTDDYNKAKEVGAAFARKLELDSASLDGGNYLAKVARDMSRVPKGPMQGYEAGFWREIESMIRC